MNFNSNVTNTKCKIIVPIHTLRIKNPSRKWWQFWKKRLIQDKESINNQIKQMIKLYSISPYRILKIKNILDKI